MKIIKISDHDYDPNWDYDVVKTNKEIQAIVQEITKDLSSKLLPKLNIPSMEVRFVRNINRLGKYIGGTSSRPVVVLDIKEIQNGIKKHNVDIKTAIETTITHELGHAMQERFQIPANEIYAEELAHKWHYKKEIPDWVSLYLAYEPAKNSNGQKTSTKVQHLIDKAMEITRNYPQKWGDCYKINSTAAYWLNKKLPEYNWRFQIWQVKAHLDGEIEDVVDGEKIMTDEPDHILVYDVMTDKYLDFSTVLDDVEVLEYEKIDDMNGQEDRKLMRLLNAIR